MSLTCVSEWHKRFKAECEEVEDDSRSGRPSTSGTEVNVEWVKQVVPGDRRLPVRMIASWLDLKKDSVWKTIAEDLGMWKVCAKMVPRLLNDDQTERLMQVCQDIIERLQTKPDLLRSVITGDETWISEYDPENKHQSCQWKSLMSPRPKKARPSKLKVKAMLITFFDVRDIVHSEFLPQGQTTKRSCGVCFAQCARRDKSCGRTNRGCFTTTMPRQHIRQFLAEKNIGLLEQPPYSPDLVLCYFFLFPKLKGSSRDLF